MSNTINISFDLTPVIATVQGLSQLQIEDMFKDVLSGVSEAVYFNWREEAHQSLHSSRSSYLRGLQQPEISENSAIIELIGVLPNMIESGASAFDIKKGMAKSDKIHFKKDGGWYISIPFRWSTAGSLGENEVFSFKMPSSVYEVAKSLNKNESLNKEDLPKNLRGLKTRPEIKSAEGKVIYGAYKHKTNVYQGMVKQTSQYEKVKQSQYVTFRTISNLSDPMSWIHPGFQPKNLAEKALNNFNINAQVNNIVNNFLASAGF